MIQTKMKTINKKAEWLRKASRRKVTTGFLPSPKECKSMAATIGRWNHNEGKPFGIMLRQLINYDTGYVQVTRVNIGKEV